MDNKRIISNLQRRIERAELDLLRQVVADHAARIDALVAELVQARREADSNFDYAEQWRENFMNLQEQLLDDIPGCAIAIKQSGEMGLFQTSLASRQ